MPHNHQYLNAETLKSCLFKKLKEGTKSKNERYTTDIPIPFLLFFLSRGGGVEPRGEASDNSIRPK